MRLFWIILVLLIVLGVCWTVGLWPQRTLIFKEQNCQCRIPNTWLLVDHPGFILDAHRLFGGAFCLAAKPASPNLRIDNLEFSMGIRSRLTTDGYEILSESREPFQGHVAYSYTMHKIINGKSVFAHSVNFVAGKFRYDLLISNTGSDPARDSQLQAALNSFSLISSSP
jgi:hypothetical protein